MRRKETMEDEQAREKHEKILYIELMNQPDPYPNASNRQVIKIGDHKTLFSLHWILLYAHARHYGIRCAYTSSQYASDRINRFLWFNYSLPGIDEQLLWRAHQYHVTKHKALRRRIKREQKKKQRELFLA